MSRSRLTSIVTVFVLVIGLSLIPSNGLADVALLDQTGGDLAGTGPFAQTIGWVLHLNTEVTLTKLGVYDAGENGLSEAHQVGLWTTAGTLLADGTVSSGTGGALFGKYRYVDVPEVDLPIGDYVVGAQYISGTADLFEQQSTLTTHSFVEYIRRAGVSSPVLVFPTIIAGPGSGNFATSNFQFTVPEPSSMVLGLLAGVGLLVWRFWRR